MTCASSLRTRCVALAYLLGLGLVLVVAGCAGAPIPVDAALADGYEDVVFDLPLAGVDPTLTPDGADLGIDLSTPVDGYAPGAGVVAGLLAESQHWGVVTRDGGVSDSVDDVPDDGAGGGPAPLPGDPEADEEVHTFYTSSGEAVTVVLETHPDRSGDRLAPTTSALEFGTEHGTLDFDVLTGGALPSMALLGSEPWIVAGEDPDDQSVGRQRISVSVFLDNEITAPGSRAGELLVLCEGGEYHRLAIGVTRAPVATVAQWSTTLAGLPALPKPHVTYPFPRDVVLSDDRTFLTEWVRVTHALTLWSRYATTAEVQRAVEICHAYNESGAQPPARLFFVAHPYHNELPHGVPPTYDGPEVATEVNRITNDSARLRDAVAAANAQLGANVEIGGLLLDTEIWYADHTKSAEHKAALDAKYNLVYDAAKSALPDVPVHWYLRGETGKYRWPRFTMNERGDSFVGSAYFGDQLWNIRRRIREIVDSAAQRNVDTVAQWVGMGVAHKEFADGQWRFTFNPRYSTETSWRLGGELNDPAFPQDPADTVPTDAIDFVAFYPHALDGRAPDYQAHFVAYVRGATGRPHLGD